MIKYIPCPRCKSKGCTYCNGKGKIPKLIEDKYVNKDKRCRINDEYACLSFKRHVDNDEHYKDILIFCKNCAYFRENI